MPDNAGMLILGALGLLWFVGRNGAANGAATGQDYDSVTRDELDTMTARQIEEIFGGSSGGRSALDALLDADVQSSGMSSGGSAAVNQPLTVGGAASEFFTSGTPVATAMAVATDTGVPQVAAGAAPPEKELVGTLSALFVAQGPTISEISGNAIRQVGLLSPTEKVLSTSNSPSVAFVDITTAGGGAPVLLEEDTLIEVLPPAPGQPEVFTIAGADNTTVVTTGINRWTESYFTTPGVLLEAVNQGYFDPPVPYVPPDDIFVPERESPDVFPSGVPVVTLGQDELATMTQRQIETFYGMN
jgi:hypothetical protein